MNPFIRKVVSVFSRVSVSLSVAVTLALSLSACLPEDDTDGYGSCSYELATQNLCINFVGSNYKLTAKTACTTYSGTYSEDTTCAGTANNLTRAGCCTLKDGTADEYASCYYADAALVAATADAAKVACETGSASSGVGVWTAN